MRILPPTVRAQVALIALLGVLCAGVFAIVHGETLNVPQRYAGALADLLPIETEVPGWRCEFRPVAETPEMMRAVTAQLGYDDALCAIYTRDDVAVEIYIAY